MKPTSLLLIASLLANVALVTVVATRSAAPSTAPGPNPTKPERLSAGSARPDNALRAALLSGTQKDLEAAEAYAQRSPWMGMLQNGLAYSTTPQPGSPGAMLPGASSQSVYPILPTGTGSGGQRQVIMSGTATTSDAPPPTASCSWAGPPPARAKTSR